MPTAPRKTDQRRMWPRIVFDILGVASVIGGVVGHFYQSQYDGYEWIPSLQLLVGGFVPIVWALPDGHRIILIPFKQSQHEYTRDEIRELRKYFNKISVVVIGCIFGLIVASLLIAGWLTRP